MAEVQEQGIQGAFIPASQMMEVNKRQSRMNGRKRTAFIPNMIAEMSKKGQFYIFNVGPKPQEGSGASYGRMIVPACEPGQAFSAPLITPGMPHEFIPKDGNTLDVLFHGEESQGDPNYNPGYDFACQVIGGFTNAKGEWNGKQLSRDNSLERFGVGISRTWPPSKEDIALANKKLNKNYDDLIQEATDAHSRGEFTAIKTPDHFVAATARGKTVVECPWLGLSATAPVEEKQLCDMCKKPYLPGTVKHDCGFVIDKKQYEKWKSEGLVA